MRRNLPIVSNDRSITNLADPEARLDTTYSTSLLAPDAVSPLKALKKHVGDLDAEVTAKVISAASDFALIVDNRGVIRDLTCANADLPKDALARWVGQPWIDTVSEDSRAKVSALLREAASKSVPRWRQVNHPQAHAADLPVQYSAIDVGHRGNIIALGRDLRPVAAMQQRLIEAQQSTEREYARLRNSETRYRALFQLVSEPILIADASNLKLLEVNPAALELLGKTAKKLIDRPLPDLFDPVSAGTLHNALTAARSGGQTGSQPLRLADGAECHMSLSLFRQATTSHLLVQLAPTGTNDRSARSTAW